MQYVHARMSVEGFYMLLFLALRKPFMSNIPLLKWWITDVSQTLLSLVFFLLEYWRVKRMGLVTGLARARARMCRYVRLSILKYRKQQGIAINTHTHLFKASISFAAWHFSCHLQFSWFFFSQILIENSSICPTFSSFFSSLQRSRISLKAFHVQKHYRLKKISIYYYQCIRFTMYIVQTSGIKQQQQQHPIGFAQHSM